MELRVKTLDPETRKILNDIKEESMDYGVFQTELRALERVSSLEELVGLSKRILQPMRFLAENDIILMCVGPLWIGGDGFHENLHWQWMQIQQLRRHQHVFNHLLFIEKILELQEGAELDLFEGFYRPILEDNFISGVICMEGCSKSPLASQVVKFARENHLRLN
jgi:hypothetical protein